MSGMLPQNTERARTWTSFFVSASFHGCVLGWVALGPGGLSERPRSIYDQQIRPYEKKLVWYNLRDKLPEVTPADAFTDHRPSRARVKFDQTLVSGAKDDKRPPKMIWTPAPELETPKLDALPNVVAVAPAPKLVRPFTPPPERRPVAPAPVLPDAPAQTAAVPSPKLPFAPPTPRPQPREFTPPPESKPEVASLPLPEAPRLVANVEAKSLALPSAGPRPQPLAFTPPPETRLQRQAGLTLPDAPLVSSSIETKGLPIAAPLPRPQPRAFTPPSGTTPATGPVGLPAAPVPTATGTAAVPSEASLAIVGINPANTTVVPAPPRSREAGFSAGPVIRPDGGNGGNSGARISVPGLLVRGGLKDDQPSLMANFSPTSRENLLAAARISLGSVPEAKPPSEHVATRVRSVPDPRLAGRMVYTVAIQMPNITSHSGSWIVWFAVKEEGGGIHGGGDAADIRPPLPLRKVDPKYIQSAVAERVEGKVLLSAVIRKDGRVDTVALLQHLDDRLDRSAEEALAKWVFEPAQRDDVAVDVDAVFEIPFHLAPKPVK